jgi:hypothetical protein
MTETLIWANTNDQRNKDVILVENNDLNNFIPKVAVSKVLVQETTEDIEITVKKIINEPFTTHNILQLLNNQVTVSSYLVTKFKATESEDISWNDFKPFLQWILDTSKLICNNCGLTIGAFSTDIVYRSSYKFCVSKEKCYHAYDDILKWNSNRKIKCSGDHYIHPKIVKDLSNLITVLDTNSTTIFQDLRLGLITLSYVITHMNQELGVFNLYLSKSDSTFNINRFYKHVTNKCMNNHTYNKKF